MDLPEVQASSRLEATVPLGDAESLERLRQRTDDAVTRPAGSSRPAGHGHTGHGPRGGSRILGGLSGHQDRYVRVELRSLASRAVPAGAPARDRLARYADAFPTAELNSSFYRWPRPAAFRSWRDRLPDGFRLSVKAPGTDPRRKLNAPETWLQHIQAGWHELGGKRAVLLVQLPPSQSRDDARLAYFLQQVPDWIRVAVEFRHPSWHDQDVFALLAEHRAAYCVTSGANLPCVLRATTDLVYVRMHGPDHQHLYAGSCSDAGLAWWADRIREWSQGQDVFVYFNNDGDANAVRNARTLQSMLVPAAIS